MYLDVLKMLQFAIVSGGLFILALGLLYIFWIRPTIRHRRQFTCAHAYRDSENQQTKGVVFNTASSPKTQPDYQLAATRQAQLTAAILGLPPQSDLQWAMWIRQGLPTQVLDSIVHRSGLSRVEIVRLLGATPETQDCIEEAQKLGPTESERLLRLATTLALAFDTFDDTAAVVSWLHLPHPELNDQSPLSMLDTEMGARSVRRTLVSVTHGISC